MQDHKPEIHCWHHSVIDNAQLTGRQRGAADY